MDQAAQWWESDGGFFGDLYKEADDSKEGHLNSPQALAERTETEINGVIELTGLQPGGAVLDCPCGYGRHSLALAEKGYQVTGADINERFLTLDNEELSHRQLPNCRFIKQDMRHIDMPGQFNAIINMFYSFGFFDSDQENMEVAKNFYNALKPGGKFLMHTHVTVPRLVSGKLLNYQMRNLASGNQLELYRRYNKETKREDGEWFVVSPDGIKKALTPYSVRIYTPEEYTAMCKEAGFSGVEYYGDWSGSPYTDDSAQMIAVAKKD